MSKEKPKAQINLVPILPFLIMVLGAIMVAFYPSINMKTIGGLIMALGVAISSWTK